MKPFSKEYFHAIQAGKMRIGRVLLFSSAVVAINMQQLCERAANIKAIEPRRFSCVVDLIHRHQTGSYKQYDVSVAEPLSVFESMNLTPGHSFQNLVLPHFLVFFLFPASKKK